MKNICFLNSVGFWGGGEKLHLEYALEFRKKGYTIIICSKKNSPLSKKSQINGLQVFNISLGNLSFLNLYKIIKLILFLKKNKTDTLIFSTSHDLKIGSISAKLAGVKNIVYLRGLAAPIKGSFVNKIIFKNLLTHIVANSEETKRSILQNLGKYIADEKIKTIYHGIEIESATKNSNSNMLEIVTKGHGVILGNAGRLTKQKGQQYLIEIAQILNEKGVDFTLFLAGTGELQEELEALIDKHNLQKNVILLGFVEEMESFMNSIDIFLLTSLWEGFGYVLVEAMIKSKPVVAFNLSSNPEIVTNNETGFLIDYPNLEMFVQKTEILIKDIALRQKLGENGCKSVLKKFNLDDRICEFEYYLLGENYNHITHL